MHREMVRIIVFTASALAIGAPAQAQSSKTPSPYPRMAPLEQYLMPDRNAEIALARSAAPKSISEQAEVLILQRKGYETAAKGANGFVCIVERAWTTHSDDPEFWNPANRAPICFNAAAARTYLPITILKTRLVLAGKSKDQMFEAIETAFRDKQLPEIEAGAMCYMLSKDGHLNDRAGHWHPHVMFYMPLKDSKSWGANHAGSPILDDDFAEDRLTVFMIPVAKWSDGTPDSQR